MPLTDQTRIARDRLKPRIIEMWRALAPLQTVVSFMNTGAHPDDETTAMLAALALRDGVDISYACSTRGEGGQNDIGTEATEALGVLRTAEMERACDVLGLRMYWHSTSPKDTIFDFGFSKSGVESMEKWGRERVLARFVDILRTEKPDVICPTFLNIPGQHGHHRAMTEAAHLVMSLAADANYADSDLPPWQVKKLYLPAWSGAGQAYDDDLPPPPATLTVSADGTDPVTGWSYERIGQQSRAFHLTQAMGAWVPTGAERNWPLHLVESQVAGPDDSVFSGLAYDLRAFGLDDAQNHIDAARTAFPDFATILKESSKALQIIKNADISAEYAHKLERKREQLSVVIRIASGAECHTRMIKDQLQPTDESKIISEHKCGLADRAAVGVSLTDSWYETTEGVRLENAALTDPYPPIYLPDQPHDPCIVLTLTTHGVESSTRIPFEVPPLVLPESVAKLSPLAEVVNLAANQREISVHLSNVSPSGATAELITSKGWRSTSNETGFALELPDALETGSHIVPLKLNSKPASSIRYVAYDHIDPRALVEPAEVKIEVIEAALPDVKIGYIGGGNDRIDHWLAQMGLDVTSLTEDDLKSDARLAEFDSIVIGIFAMKFRDGLATQMPRIHRWIEAGGTLLTLYHRPWDNWDKDTTAPEMLEIGQPSLRWRVTDEDSNVTHLVEHPLLSTPNKIAAEDWQGWHKERGLYFAKSWSDAYTPLLEMADPNEAPHQGALLTADIGKGRHTHCALILHHQMEKLVPGAFRLMANLVAKRDQ